MNTDPRRHDNYRYGYRYSQGLPRSRISDTNSCTRLVCRSRPSPYFSTGPDAVATQINSIRFLYTAASITITLLSWILIYMWKRPVLPRRCENLHNTLRVPLTLHYLFLHDEKCCRDCVSVILSTASRRFSPLAVMDP